MFEMDAFVGVDVLGLSFMKGEQPHAGFPEAAYHGMAEQLARAGYRVVVVEQVSTWLQQPLQLQCNCSCCDACISPALECC
jgi:DNA mismatch repair protein MSH6